ncbi:MAG TPA: hypothetical protein VIG99_27870 [Myxococcaceae bacterium]|jgi:hypothetical protein
MPEFNMTVPATTIWYDTGVDLDGTAKSVTITATGQWTANPATGMVEPDGNAQYIGKPGYAMEGEYEGLLVGKVSADGQAFAIGSSGSVAPGAIGELYLSINDDVNAQYGVGFPDNEGSVDVVITVDV